MNKICSCKKRLCYNFGNYAVRRLMASTIDEWIEKLQALNNDKECTKIVEMLPVLIKDLKKIAKRNDRIIGHSDKQISHFMKMSETLSTMLEAQNDEFETLKKESGSRVKKIVEDKKKLFQEYREKVAALEKEINEFKAFIAGDDTPKR